VSLSRIFQQLINGPGDKNNFLDSFPIKPSVIDAKRENDTLVLNLDDNFGHGISFETAELQVKQILKTASQFKDIKYLKITINSGDIENISIDGLTIPSRFKLN
jgi:spore germination protein GerM